jgi:hypothetical protein
MEEENRQPRTSIPRLIECLIPVTLEATPEATPLDQTIIFIKEEFGISENIKHPFILFFQTDGENIIDSFVVKLKQEELEKAFLELKRLIKNAVNSLIKVTPENYENHKELFNLIRTGVQGGNAIEYVNNKVLSKIGIGTIIALIKTIAG